MLLQLEDALPPNPNRSALRRAPARRRPCQLPSAQAASHVCRLRPVASRPAGRAQPLLRRADVHRPRARARARLSSYDQRWIRLGGEPWWIEPRGGGPAPQRGAPLAWLALACLGLPCPALPRLALPCLALPDTSKQEVEGAERAQVVGSLCGISRYTYGRYTYGRYTYAARVGSLVSLARPTRATRRRPS